jgi:xanthine dehydrogenase iron-sulfur cluster and FAD-binding subunit A
VALRRANGPGGFVDVRRLGLSALLLETGAPDALRRFSATVLRRVEAQSRKPVAHVTITARVDKPKHRSSAMTRMAELERSPEVAMAAPLVAEAVGLVAHTPIRNRATIGGSLAHADPAAELPAAALALGADLVAVGPAGPRTVPVAEFL